MFGGNQATSPSTMTRRDDKIRKSQTILRQVNFFQKLTNPSVSNNRKFKMKISSFLKYSPTLFSKGLPSRVPAKPFSYFKAAGRQTTPIWSIK